MPGEPAINSYWRTTMADTLLRHVALVTESEQSSFGDLTKISAALQKQVVRDLAHFWHVQATVDAFQKLEDVPIGYWPIIVMDNIGYDAAGIHLDDNNQPFALVTASDQLDVWSLTTSHELIEMLLDPFGSRLIAGDSPKADQKRVQFLLEACDPSESAEYAYTVNGILVSDFYSVRFFDPMVAPGVRYSFTGAIQAPRQVLNGGYLSWLDVASDTWWQETWFAGSKPTFRNLGHLSATNGSFRSQVDRLTFKDTTRAVAGGIRAAKAAGLSVATMDDASSMRATRLRAQIRDITGAVAEAEELAIPIEVAGGQRPAGPRGRRGNGPLTEGLRSAPSVSAERSMPH
jgi:hypothetical protein